MSTGGEAHKGLETESPERFVEFNRPVHTISFDFENPLVSDDSG
jgi:hypothetical protein